MNEIIIFLAGLLSGGFVGVSVICLLKAGKKDSMIKEATKHEKDN